MGQKLHIYLKEWLKPSQICENINTDPRSSTSLSTRINTNRFTPGHIAKLLKAKTNNKS